MLRTAHRTVFLALALVGALFVTACGGDDDADTGPGAAPGAVTELPDSWPTDVTLPPGAKIQDVTGETTLTTVAVESKDSLDDIVAHFENTLRDWEPENDPAGGDAEASTAFLTWTRGDQRLTLVVSDAAALRSFLISIGPV